MILRMNYNTSHGITSRQKRVQLPMTKLIPQKQNNFYQ